MTDGFSRDPMMTRDHVEKVDQTAPEAIQQVVMANRILSNEGILDALGHVSLRNPGNADTFFQARSISPFEVMPEDILEIDLDGDIITQTTEKPYGERIIHGAILRARPEMNAVFHGHFAAVIPFSVTSTPIRPITHVGSFLYQGVPIYDDYEPGEGMLIRTKQEGERIARHLGQHRVHLLRGHGCNIVAENLPRLVASAIYLKENATIQWQTVLSGKEAKYLSPKEAKAAMEIALFGASPIDRMWRYWVARVKRNMPDMKDWEETS
ncbi:MAG TPA: class II aldolase/adducin family protein [Thermodesulfobacteriota bacterium]|nr:class II aldolase/adducin family protein [Thermodesulfobacteriota bacterium]